MRVFVGFGYNARDSWIEEQVIPILRCVGFTVVHGKGMEGQVLHPEVMRRLDQSEAAIGFFTIRDGQGDADFTSHIWVRDELVYAVSQKIPVIPIRENDVKVPEGLLGNRQYIPLDQNDRLRCLHQLLLALGQQQSRRVRLDPSDDTLGANLWKWWKGRGQSRFVIQYRTRNPEGLESNFRSGRLEVFENAFYLNLLEVSNGTLVEVEGRLNDNLEFGSGWVSADAVQIIIR
jgi:hypothetical protein